MANIASWGFVVLMAWRLFLDETTRKSLTAYVLIGLAWYSLLVITGYFGGRLVFEYGAAVVGARPTMCSPCTISTPWQRGKPMKTFAIPN